MKILKKLRKIRKKKKELKRLLELKKLTVAQREKKIKDEEDFKKRLILSKWFYWLQFKNRVYWNIIKIEIPLFIRRKMIKRWKKKRKYFVKELNIIRRKKKVTYLRIRKNVWFWKLRMNRKTHKNKKLHYTLKKQILFYDRNRTKIRHKLSKNAFLYKKALRKFRRRHKAKYYKKVLRWVKKCWYIGREWYLKKILKDVSKFYYMIIKSTLNNFYVTLVNIKGEVKISNSCGNIGIKLKKKRKNYESLYDLVENVSKKMKLLGILKIFILYYGGLKLGGLRHLLKGVVQRIISVGIKLQYIKMLVSRSHNGMRKKKLKRL